jgi:hypothetical protein
MLKNDCVVDGVTYHPEIQRGVSYSLAWDRGLAVFIVRLTQFPNIFYLRIVKVGWRFPPLQTLSVWESTKSFNKKEVI